MYSRHGKKEAFLGFWLPWAIAISKWSYFNAFGLRRARYFRTFGIMTLAFLQ